MWSLLPEKLVQRLVQRFADRDAEADSGVVVTLLNCVYGLP